MHNTFFFTWMLFLSLSVRLPLPGSDSRGAVWPWQMLIQEWEIKGGTCWRMQLREKQELSVHLSWMCVTGMDIYHRTQSSKQQDDLFFFFNIKSLLDLRCECECVCDGACAREESWIRIFRHIPVIIVRVQFFHTILHSPFIIKYPYTE